MVIDHSAKPKLRAWRNDADALAVWVRHLRNLARYPQVWCKLSGLLTEAGPHWQAAGYLLPAMRILLELFGPSRLLCGSDWPVMTLAGRYDQRIALSDRVLANLTMDKKRSGLWPECT
ncbi:MAG: amidohydrolase family protein [Ferrovibrio sp.]|uniref:amidohydrolase family protein n=1 Tax=Ferrovibrio sp. TaxID=1917215 RepID=UPI0026327E6E|nr:amidohydrolase family protein [Ferrovibrio sp.]MCW0234965.1 amidohydrolase family protein [Ferrovibrio sp.]